jgi:hypothetical protein
MTLLDRDLATDHARVETQGTSVGGDLLPVGHRRRETHSTLADGHLFATDHQPDETHVSDVGGDPSCPAAIGRSTPSARPLPGTFSTQLIDEPTTQRGFGWVELRMAADLFDRAQQERIAVGNLIRSPLQGGNIDPIFFGEHLARLEVVEHQARLMMRRTYKRIVPPELRAWQKSSRGVGDDLFARLLGHLGDPYIATPHYWEGTGKERTLMVEEPRVRTIGQLWQYAGHGDPHRRKTKGMTADEAFALGSPMVKMLVHLNAEACMKQPAGSHYREVYVATRAKVLDKAHSTACVRCGPSGKPAAEGSPWSLGHQHAHALRIVGKELLRDMWLARHHAEGVSQ